MIIRNPNYEVIAVDFDGTIVENKYPQIGDINWKAREVINDFYNSGGYIVINTCRVGEYERQAILKLHESGVKFHTVNANIPFVIAKYGVDCRKISADMYIDDRNFGGVDWDAIEKELFLRV